MTIRFLLIVILSFPLIAFSQNERKVTCVRELKYPKEADDKNISGTVIVVFDIDSSCRRINARIEKSIGYGCDEEAIRFVTACNKIFGASKIKCTPIKGLRQPVTFDHAKDEE